jgi:hypothetical protein
MRYDKHILLEGRIEDAKNFFINQIGDSWPYTEEGNPYHHFLQGVNLEDRFNLFVENDPSSNNKYLKWMIDTYLGEHGIAPIDIYSVVQKFDTNLNRLTPNFIDGLSIDLSSRIKKSPKDINSYAYLGELERVVDELEQIATRKEKEKKAKKEIDRIYEDDNWLIIKPKSYESSCYYGAGTKWCTASKQTPAHFENYSEKGVLYYIIKKEKTFSGEDYKVALFKPFPKLRRDNRGGLFLSRNIPSDEFYNMRDERLAPSVIEVLTNTLPTNSIRAINTTYENELEEFKFSFDDSYMSLDEFSSLLTERLKGQQIKFNTESGPWELEVVGRSEWYVSPIGDNKYKFSVELFIDTEYEIIVSDFQREIKPTPDNDVDELIGWYFKILEGKIVESSRREGYKEIKGPGPAGNLGLPEEERFKQYFLDKDRRNYAVGYPEKQFINYILLPNLKYLLSRPEVKEKTGKQLTSWQPTRGVTTIKFKYPPKEGSLTQLFVDFVKNNPGKTRKEFYDSIGRPYSPGNNAEFFSVINNAGIVKMERQGRQFVYTLGPNYEDWVNGKLFRI